MDTDLSLLVPFRDDDGSRGPTWRWLRRYWERELPEAEIVIGEYEGTPYSRAAALNDAAHRASGYVFAVVDADCFLAADAVRECARRIAAADHPTWFIPWRRRVNLTQKHSNLVMSSNASPVFPTDPAGLHAISETVRTSPCGIANILSRRAWDRVGGFDERFVGWGGEDIAFIASVDTLYGRHLRFPADVFHLWHPYIGKRFRLWAGEERPHSYKGLMQRYKEADGVKSAMRTLLRERA